MGSRAKGNGALRDVNALDWCIDFRLSGDLWLDECNDSFSRHSLMLRQRSHSLRFLPFDLSASGQSK